MTVSHISLQKDNLALVESLGPVEVSVPARRNPFCSRRPVRDEGLHISVRFTFYLSNQHLYTSVLNFM